LLLNGKLAFSSYAQLHETLGGGLDGTPPRALKEYLLARKDTLSDLKSIFGKPSDASRKKIQNGSLKLADGVTVKIDEPDKEYIFAISDRYHIDEVQAFILFRSFLFNRGLPERVKADAPTAELKEGLLEVIAPYYYSERLFVIKTLGPLLRAYQDTEEPLHDVATEFLPEIAHDPIQFALDLVTEYVAKTREMLPDSLRMAPKSALEWIKQNLKEQLALLEVVFWTMWGYTPCASPVVVQIFKAAYDTTLGTAQANSTLMLDEESQQLLQDSAAYWILITVEALELEHVGHDDVLELSETPTGKILYISSPDTLSQLHDIVNSDTNSQFACTYLAWTYVLSRIVAKAKTLEAVPPAYQNFLNMINPTLTRAYTKDPEPLHVDMAKACIAPEAGLFSLLNNLLTKSPVFVLSAAWKTGSSVTEPNMIAYRSVLKGEWCTYLYRYSLT
jgi:nuclear pore complex protein Nup188